MELDNGASSAPRYSTATVDEAGEVKVVSNEPFVISLVERD